MALKRSLAIIGILLVSILLMTGCAGEGGKTVKDGDTVKVHYTGTLDDGTVFDTSREREPLEFTLGQGGIIAGFENAVLGMAIGDIKTVTFPPEEAYGEVREDLLLKIPREQFPEEMELQTGQQLQLQSNDGQIVIATVLEIADSEVTVDANHPLAGKDLTFEIEVMEIN